MKILSKMSHISFTVDGWMSPNMKAFIPDWKMIDVLIGMPAFQGECFGLSFFFFLGSPDPFNDTFLGWHTGSNFGNILVEMLDDLELSKKLIIITADNSSSNSTLASRVKHRLVSLKPTVNFWDAWPT
ncbi:uncharacterized protein VP01_7555g1 [Puccinia sorghi]|uniref:Uncharacterized protein n=1 Tax=Puccinia sorghi TaxID=27349 RepID=A0A0L6UCY1_9BASI|nr:uncharacterized protein VP01_7555g1 [Puccinia sorghi]